MTSKRLDITISTTGLLASHHSSTTYVDKSLHQHSRQRPLREATVRPTVRLKELQSTVAESGVKFTREPFQDLWSLKAVWEAWLEKNHQHWKSMKDVGSYFWRGGFRYYKRTCLSLLKTFLVGKQHVCHLSFRRIRWLSWGLNIFRKARFHDRSKK